MKQKHLGHLIDTVSRAEARDPQGVTMAQSKAREPRLALTLVLIPWPPGRPLGSGSAASAQVLGASDGAGPAREGAPAAAGALASLSLPPLPSAQALYWGGGCPLACRPLRMQGSPGPRASQSCPWAQPWTLTVNRTPFSTRQRAVWFVRGGHCASFPAAPALGPPSVGPPCRPCEWPLGDTGLPLSP